ncbi:MAG: DUF423 domain-containing protein [Cytophagaceae bacterium]
MNSLFIQLGSIAGTLAVMIGAFGAHKWKPYLQSIEKLDVYQTGVEYQFYHALALVMTGILMASSLGNAKYLQWAGWSFAIGILLFSGSLYMICITQVNKWGAVAPIGGTAFIVGWISLFLAFTIKNS